MNKTSAIPDRKAILKEALNKIEELQARLETLERRRTEAIAVIGLGCRFPGGVTGPESYWRLLQSGGDAITEVPPERWSLEAFYDPDRNAPGKTYTRWGGYLQDIDKFDPHFFGISPREALHMDPQQRLFLEVAWEALENAGIAPEKLYRSQTGVYVGVTTTEYGHLHTKYLAPASINAYTVSGNVNNCVSGRVAFLLGLHGPAISVDTACSSSQVALHLACQAIRSGDCDAAIAGGVNVILLPETYISFSKWGMFSADGRCRTFDAGARGFVRSEGCGAVILKPLSKALADGDKILALIRGTAANQDGPSSGISVPNGLAQEQVIRLALQNAGVKPEEVQFVETHGTGTTLGDPIEVEALGAVYGEGHSQENPVLLGAVKTNLGHMESASGIAGLIKVVLSLYHEEIPPNLHLQKLSPQMPWEKLPLAVPTQRTPWPRGEKPRRAGLSSFGFSGTNVHVILEEAPPAGARLPASSERLSVSGDRPSGMTGRERTHHLLTLSAKDGNALREMAQAYAQHLSTHSSQALPDVCHTANSGRARFAHRLAVIANSPEQMRDRLLDFAAGREVSNVFAGETSGKRGKLAFLYAGQGYQYAGMGRVLFDTQPTFRKALEQCQELFQPYLKTPLLDVLYPDVHGTDPALIDQTFYTQPAMFALQYALTVLWRSWGIEPAVVMGHSLGEFMAAHLAGVYSLEDAVKLVAERGRLTDDVPAVGMMASVQAGEEQVRQALAPYGENVCIAAINGPDSIVITGIKEAVHEVLDRFEKQGLNVRRLAISNAFHSPFIEPALESFSRVAAEVTYHRPKLRLVSTLTGNLLDFNVEDGGRGNSAFEAQAARHEPGLYWRRHLREPVQFYAAMRTLHEMGVENFLEIGPNPTQLAMGRRCLPEGYGGWFPSLRQGRDDWQQMLESVGAMFVRGLEVDWQRFEQDYKRGRVWLPTYPFQRKRYWIDDDGAKREGRGAESEKRKVKIKHQARFATQEPRFSPLAGHCTRSPLLREIVVESRLSLESFPYLQDHQVHGMVVLPLTGHLEIILAGARMACGAETRVLEDMVIREPLLLPEKDECVVQAVFTPLENGAASFQLISFGTEKRDAHKVHVTGKVAPATAGGHTAAAPRELAVLRARCTQELEINEYYDELRARGLEFGPGFRGLSKLWRREGESLAQVELPAALQPGLDDYQLHPAQLDACLQAFVAAWPRAETKEAGLQTYLPLNVERYCFHRSPKARLWSNVVIHEAEKKNAETYAGDVWVYDEDGLPVAELKGLLVKRTSAEALLSLSQEGVAEWLYEIAWRPRPLAALAQKNSAAAHCLAAPAQIAGQAQAGLEAWRAGRELAAYEELLPQLDALCLAYVMQAFEQLGWKWLAGRRFTAAALAQELRIVERHQRLLRRMLEMLAEEGVLEQESGEWEVCRIPESGNPDFQCNVLLSKYPACKTELALTGKCGQALAKVLRGECDPLQLLFPGGSVEFLEKLYQHSPLTQAMNGLAAEALTAAVAPLARARALRVLEIGAGTGGTTAFALPRLAAHCAEYFFTDVSPLFLHTAQQKFRDYPCVHYQALDIERDPAGQGFSTGFDLVIAANVLHATADLRRSLRHAQKLLAPGGLLLLLEGTARERWVDLTFGLTEGWWKFSDLDLRPDYALLSKEGWLQLLGELGFTGAHIVPAPAEKDRVGRALAQHAMIVAAGPHDLRENAAVPQHGSGKTPAPVPQNGLWFIFADKAGLGEKLANMLAARGRRCILVSAGEAFQAHGGMRFTLDPCRYEDFQRLFQETLEPGSNTCAGVVYLWALDQRAGADMPLPLLQQAQRESGAAALHLVQAMIKNGGADTPRLWLVTQGAQQVAPQSEPVEILQAPLWGLGKVIALEHPELRCVRLDLDPACENCEFDLFDEIWAAEREDLVAYRANARYVARLVRCAVQGEERGLGSEERRTKIVDRDLRFSILDPRTSEAPVQLHLATPGVLDSLQYRPGMRRPPADGEVEIRVQATGLNFRDVLNALGMYPGDAGPLGGECSGRIVAVGDRVKDFRVGEEVMAIAIGSFSNFATTHADLVVRKPEHLSFAEAATIPSAFMTAYYALIALAHLQAGERVLIHSAAGGVGLAAVQLAQRAGAEIFATAGSAEKREFLRDLGVRYVLDSRSLAFAREIMQYTNEEGVEVVLNSLSGEFIPTSLSVLKDDGRFIEIGKRGIWTRQQVDDFKRVGQYHVVDLAAAAQEHPALIKSLLLAVTAGIEDRSLRPLPMRIFSSSDVCGAFRCMQAAKHIGKIVVSQSAECAAPAGQEEAPAGNRGAKAAARHDTICDPPSASREPRRISFKADATYLITGGLAGLGLLTARWLVERGARHLALLARSAPSEAARAAIAELEGAGAKIFVASADVARAEEIKSALSQIRQNLPPLRGVIHSAGVLDDGALVQQKWERFEKVLAPKVYGAWLLHQLTQEQPLDFFVLYSSMASMLGSAGQGNHAMANAFLDGLAHHRRRRGQPGTSIHWGAWSEIGAAAERNVSARVSAHGLGAIPPQKGLQALEMILLHDLAEAGVSPVNWAKFTQSFAGGSHPPFFSELLQAVPARAESETAAPAPPGPKILEQIQRALPHARKGLLLNYVKDQARRVLGLEPSQSLDPEQPLQKMGLDSLMAVELRNVLGAGLGLPRALPATLLFDYPSAAAVADYLAQEVLALETAAQAASEPPSNNGRQSAAAQEMEKLSDEEAEALLLKELQKA